MPLPAAGLRSFPAFLPVPRPLFQGRERDSQQLYDNGRRNIWRDRQREDGKLLKPAAGKGIQEAKGIISGSRKIILEKFRIDIRERDL